MDDSDEEVENVEDVPMKEYSDEEFAALAAEAVRTGVQGNDMPIAFNGSNERLKLWAKKQSLPTTMRPRIAFWLRAAILVKKERPQKAKA